MAVVESFNIADQSNKDLRKKLKEEEQARRSTDSALEGVQKQVEDQMLLLRDDREHLASSKEQIASLRKKLEEVHKLKDQAEKSRDEAERVNTEAEKARDEAEQHGYDVGEVETEDAVRAEVPTVCRTYCAQTWDEALNRAGVEASSELRKPEKIFYPPTIRASDLPSTQGEVASTIAVPTKAMQP